MNAKKCDICGKLYETGGNGSMLAFIETKDMSNVDLCNLAYYKFMDLCPECTQHLKDWCNSKGGAINGR